MEKIPCSLVRTGFRETERGGRERGGRKVGRERGRKVGREAGGRKREWGESKRVKGREQAKNMRGTKL